MFILWFHLFGLLENILNIVNMKAKVCVSLSSPLPSLTPPLSSPFFFYFQPLFTAWRKLGFSGPHLNRISQHLQMNFINLGTIYQRRG